MTRYEGMDELLRGVRERLGAGKQLPTEETPARRSSTMPLPVFDETYDSAVRRLKTLRADAERAREILTGQSTDGLTDDQRDHLLAILHEVMEELWATEAGLQGVK
jgi:hypothetical protein